MTVADLQKDNRVFLDPEDVANAIGVSKHAFILQVEEDIDAIPFPVLYIKGTIRIPRKKFLEFLGYDHYADDDDVFTSKKNESNPPSALDIFADRINDFVKEEKTK